MRPQPFLALVLAASCGVDSQPADRIGADVQPAFPPSADAAPFVFGDQQWESQHAFVSDGHVCGSAITELELEAQEAEYAAAGGSIDPSLRIGGGTITGGVIETHFHVVHDGNTGLLTSAEVDDQIDALNTAFATTGWSFNLASTTFTDNPSWFNAAVGSFDEVDMKATLRAGTADTLNIYSIEPGGTILGWATFPPHYVLNPDYDGIVIHYDTIPGGFFPYDEGIVAVHEVGHWMGLFHTFERGCSNRGDRVADTASEAGPNYGCPFGVDSCPAKVGADPVDNYMDYTNDACKTTFTTDQDFRMDTAWTLFREGK